MRSADGAFANRRGFTMIELLVAASLMALIAGGLLAITTSVLAHWNRASESIARSMRAEAALDLLERDLAGALVENENAVFVVRMEDVAGNPVDESMSLRFYSSSAGPSTDAGAIRAVAWYTAVDDGASPFIDDTIPSLFRAATDPAETWARVRAKDGRSPREYADEPTEAFLLAHCVSLRVDAWAARADGTLLLLNDGGPAGRLQVVGDRLEIPWSHAAGEARAELAFIDVSIRLLSAPAAERLRRQREGTAETAHFGEASWIQSHSEVFHRRIRLIRAR